MGLIAYRSSSSCTVSRALGNRSTLLQWSQCRWVKTTSRTSAGSTPASRSWSTGSSLSGRSNVYPKYSRTKAASGVPVSTMMGRSPPVITNMIIGSFRCLSQFRW